MVERLTKSFELRFLDGRDWIPLPNWARFFVSLGAALATAHSAERRIVAAISVPTSSFAAAFITLGRILSEPVFEPAKNAVEAHFNQLAALPSKTPLVYFNGEALYNGLLLGTSKRFGEDFVQMAIGGVTCMVPKYRCLFVDFQPQSPLDIRFRH